MICREVRSVLARHFVDLGRISIQASAGVLSLRGTLQCMYGSTQAFTAQTVDSIMKDLAGIKGVGRVSAEFDNWRKADPAGPWGPIVAHSKQNNTVLDNRRLTDSGSNASTSV